jgi:hypothetical protein
VNYSKTAFELYQDVIQFRSISTLEYTQKHVEMVYLSALVRRMLSRELGRLPKKLKRVIPDSFMPSHKTWTNWYLIKAGKAIARDEVQKAVARRDCENARRDDCDKKDEVDTVLGYLLLHMLFYPLVHSWIAVQDWLTVLYM